MGKDQVIAKLREHETELRAAGAEHVSLFGSVARGEATEVSDLDVLVTLSDLVIQSSSHPVRLGGISVLSQPSKSGLSISPATARSM